jgi:hypothetical protein
MERVSIISGHLPIIIIAPHGFNGDDEHTSIVAEHTANAIGAYAVINRGWERGENVDYMLDKADCNDANHCHEDVVKEEFLEPILRYKNKILQHHSIAHIYYIHGMSNKHRKITGDPNLDMVIGYGAGSPDSHTCSIWRKDLLCHLLNEAGVHTWEGKKGGPMSGWARANMNQLFRKWYNEPQVQSMQIEIIHELRETPDAAIITAEYLATAVKDMLGVKSFSPSKPVNAY